MLRLAKDATPAATGCVRVPDRVPPPAFVPIATVTLPVKVGAVLPCASRAVTCTAGATAVPAVALLGCTANTRWVAPPAETLNAELVGDVSPVAAAVRV